MGAVEQSGARRANSAQLDTLSMSCQKKNNVAT
jgi:hypothetical protein